MRAVAVALVLIAGAAVFLWFGNMLNSWVLGGLIGGFAALLLSIPISLTLFSYLARRHDERSYAQAQEDFVPLRDYDVSPRTLRAAYEIESYVLPVEDGWDEDALDDHRRYPARDLPVPPSRRLPAVAQSRVARNLSLTQRDTLSRTGKPSSRALDAWSSDEASERRSAGRRPPTGEIKSNRGRLQSEALRLARQEAVRQHGDDDIEELPTYSSRRLPSNRPGRSRFSSEPLSPEQEQPAPRRPYRPLSERTRKTTGRQRQDDDLRRRSFYEEDESTDDEFFGPGLAEAQTDYLQDNYPRTEPMNPPRRTGPLTRPSRLNERPLEARQSLSTGDLRRPRVRRAPYMYDDDPLRQELSQHLDTPIVRRSSRLNSRRLNNEDDWD